VQARQVWPVQVIASRNELSLEFAKAVDVCRRARYDAWLAGRTTNDELFAFGGRTTSCHEIFTAYDGQMSAAMAPLRQSSNPVERGYYQDARYNDLADDHDLQYVVDDPAILERRAKFWNQGDELFGEVLRDADVCDMEGLVRLHLAQKLASSRFQAPEIQFLIAYALVVKDYTDAGLVAYMRLVGERLQPDRQEALKLQVFAAAASCGRGALQQHVLAFEKR
jgi:hypothetical protein